MTRHVRLLWLLALVAPAVARAGEVIVNDSLATLTQEEIRDVFLGEKLFLGRVRVMPVDNSTIEALFLAKILQTDIDKYRARWTRKSFHEGLGAPPIKGSDAEVIAFVRATPGAIGYISKPVAGLRVIQSF